MPSRLIPKTRKKRRSVRKTKRGGKYIGHGSYGCAYAKPGIRCMGDPVVPNNIISKIMDYKEGIQEFDTRKYVYPLDPYQQYFLYPVRICHPDYQTPEEERENPYKICPSLQDKQYAPVLIQLMYGGFSYDKLKEFGRLTYRRIGDILLGWRNLFEGLDILHSNNIAHIDIKPANIVISPESNHSRLIDFGMTVKTTESMSHVDQNPVNATYNYPTWPFEFRFIYKKYTPLWIKQSVIDTFYATCVKRPSQAPFDLFPVDVYYNGGNVVEGEEKVNPEFMLGVYRNLFSLEEIDRINLLTKGADVYALGRSLSSIYVLLMRHAPNGPRNVALIANRSAPIDYLQKPPTMSDSLYNWHRTVIETISIPFFNLIRKMMAVDPVMRISIRDAKVEYERICLNITNLFSRINLKNTVAPFSDDSSLLYTPTPPKSYPFLPTSNSDEEVQ